MSCEIIGSLSVSELSAMIFWFPSLCLSRFLPRCVFKHYSCFPFWHSLLMFSVFYVHVFLLQWLLSKFYCVVLSFLQSHCLDYLHLCLVPQLCPSTVLLFLHSFGHNISESVFVLLVLIVGTLLPLSAACSHQWWLKINDLNWYSPSVGDVSERSTSGKLCD